MKSQTKAKRFLRRTFLACLACTLALGAILGVKYTGAWWAGGHRFCTLAAASRLPQDMPEFFRASAEALAEMAPEPDNWKKALAPHLRAAEQPEHFIDLEHLEGRPMFRDRYDLLKYYYFKNADPAKAGFLPNAILESYERLLLAFHDCRQHPHDHILQQRLIVYAGWLAHYCQDAGMPLHTSKFYDGRPGANGQVEQAGIHAKIDAYPQKYLTPAAIAEGLAAEASADVWPVITRAVNESHKYVDQCYELDKQGAFNETAPEKGRALMLERARASAKLTLDLWYSAWKNSAD